MAFSKLEDSMTYIEGLPDTPNSANGWTAEKLKRQFDKAGIELKEFVNRLVDELASAAAAGNIGIEEISGIAASTVQQALAALKTEIDNVSVGGIPDGSLTGAKLEDLAVSEAKIGAAAVSTGKLRDEAVTENKLAGGAVTQDKLALNAVGTGELQAGCVTENKLAAKSVTAGKIADGQIADVHLANRAVTRNKILDGEVIRPKIADKAVNGSKLDLESGSLPWAKLTYGVHYFNQGDTLPTATAGRIIFVKR